MAAMRIPSSSRALVLGLLSFLGAFPSPLSAVCNLIPGTTNTFRATLGNVDRPFAGPGDVVELRLTSCHTASPGFAAPAAANIVTIAFRPPHDGPRHLVVVAADCGALDEAQLACDDGGEAGIAHCIDADATGLALVEIGGERRLRFHFPDTDALLEGPNDGRTLTGPAAIAVTTLSQPIPCGLAATPCGELSGVVACVDSLFATDGSCGHAPHPTFAQFIALPPANDYRALCVDPSPPCTGTADEIRFTVDGDGNILLPMDWRGILVGEAVPIARLLRGSGSIPAFPFSALPLRVPSSDFLAAFAPNGGRLPPIFEPQTDPADADLLTLFGTADAPADVLRIAPRSPTGLACAGGARDTLPCTAAADCPDGGCTEAPELFDFRSRLHAGIGPVIVPRFGPGVCQNSGATCASDATCAESRCVSYRLEAKDPVPLDGLVETPRMLAAVIPEAIDGITLNRDGDAFDDVVVLTDRQSGRTQAIGARGRPGRATVRIRQPPFSFPAVVAADDVVAFLEPEPLEGFLCRDARLCDFNGDGDVADTILRVYRLGAASATELTAGQNLAVDAAPLVAGRSLALSDRLLFFRSREASRCRLRYSEFPSGSTYAAVLSPDGRLVASGSSDPFTFVLHDRLSGGSEVITWQPPDPAALAELAAIDLAFSADARTIAFTEAFNEHTNEAFAAFVYDRDSGTTSVVSVNAAGENGNDTSVGVAISANGQMVAFASNADNLVDNDTNDAHDVFVHDRSSGETTRVSVTTAGLEASGLQPGLSGDGRFVVFSSDADSLFGPPDPLGRRRQRQIFVHDRRRGETTQVSIGTRGEQPTGRSADPVISADGRYVAFWSSASNLAAGEPRPGIFLHDRQTGETTRVSVDSVGRDSVGTAEFIFAPLSISADGRYVAFASENGLVPSDFLAGTIGEFDAFVHDRITGIVEAISIPTSGRAYELPNFGTWVSADGSVTAFNGIPDTKAPTRKTIVRDCDPADTASDLSGDGDHDDTVLQVLNTQTLAIETLCPAESAVVRDGAVAFLRPEGAGRSPRAPGCPVAERLVDGKPDLNGDGDARDSIVHLWRAPGAVQNLRCAATQLSLTPTHLAALVSEAAQGDGSLNGDDDEDDRVVFVRRSDASAPASCRDASWIDTGQAAEYVAADAAIVAMLTAESDQGGTDLNGDGDTADRIVQVFDADALRFLAVRDISGRAQPAEDLVLAAGLLAFRTRELSFCAADDAVDCAAASGCECDLNGDGDCCDDVLQVFDPVAETLINTGQAITPCAFEACDPRRPYRVERDTATFLTLECNQGGTVTSGCPSGGQDLNGDGDAADLVLQTFNVRLAADGRARDPNGDSIALRFAHTAVRETSVFSQPLSVIGAIAAGVCTADGQPCVADRDCHGGRCFVPPGGCLANHHEPCPLDETIDPCAAGTFCAPVVEQGELLGSCHEVLCSDCCETDVDCGALAPGAVCHTSAVQSRRIFSPLSQPRGGGVAFPALDRGRCSRDPTVDCATDGDCPSQSRCERKLIIGASADSDGDELADAFDNCPLVANIMQEDGDADGVGDACEAPPTSPQANQDDGCQIDASPSAAPIALLLLPALALLARRSRRSPTHPRRSAPEMRPDSCARFRRSRRRHWHRSRSRRRPSLAPPPPARPA